MDAIFYLFVLTVVCIALLASIAIWSPRAVCIRVAAVSVAVGLMALGYASLASLLAKPKPRQLVWLERNVDEAEILGASFSEGKAIYLWLRLKGMIEPRYYQLPWNKKTAEDLEDELEAASKRGHRIKVIKPFTNDQYAQQGGLNIKIVPPPSLPLKPPRFPARVFNPRSTDI